MASASGKAQDAKPALAPADAARYLELVRQEAELTGQFKLAKELTELHTQRAEEASRTNRPEKVPWETDNAKELRDRANALSTQLAAVTKDRTGLEEKSKLSFSLLSTAAAASARSLTADETAYLNRLDTLVFSVDQEIVELVNTGRLFTYYLQTNNTPEDMARIAVQAQENGRLQKQMEREKASLEVQKLLFRALKK